MFENPGGPSSVAESRESKVFTRSQSRKNDFAGVVVRVKKKDFAGVRVEKYMLNSQCCTKI